jgi:hypothetical protein
MSQFGTKEWYTVTVLGSQALARPDGRVAIGLETRELGAIAFAVDQRSIDELRRDLSAAEQLLRQPTGKH